LTNFTLSFSQVDSPIVAYLANNIISSNSITNSSAKSCRSNAGIGRGLIVQLEDNFCTSGSSSAGYGILSADICGNVISYFMFLSHSFPYMKRGPQVQTGSGGYGYYSPYSENGAGGGVIFILA
jgi:hypothetical protein